MARSGDRSIRFEHERYPLAHNQVLVVDVTTGKVFATVDGSPTGGASIHEGKQTRTIDKLPACK
ncbi:MAG: hypothetical protein JWO36_4090 [Myxococcales bacterium]|nr:hypothetical protein [Myxococcales bacterium]